MCRKVESTKFKDQTCDGDMTAISVQTGVQCCVCVVYNWEIQENLTFQLIFNVSFDLMRRHLLMGEASFVCISAAVIAIITLLIIANTHNHWCGSFYR